MKRYRYTAELLLSLILAGSAHGIVVNESFESWDPLTGGNNSAAYPYPAVTGWTYAGTSGTADLLGAISETLATVPDTPNGENWLLVDSRIATREIYQSVGTITIGDQMSLSALIGRVTGANAVTDFELALYRSNSGSGTPDTLLTAIGKTNPIVAALATGATGTATANYTATALDAGETLFVRIRRLSTGPNPVQQVLIDNVIVTIGTDTTPPSLTGISDDQGGGPVAVGTAITYTVTFNEDMDDTSVDTSDFDTQGTAATTIDSVSETSPGQFAVQVTPTSAGTMQLLIPAGSILSDVATPANNLNTTNDLLDDTIITVDATGPGLVLPTSPADNASGLSIVTSLVAVFDEAIALAAPVPLVGWDFESDDGGFTIVTSGTAWTWGEPDSSGPGGTVSSGSPGSTLGCWGTNLGDFSGSGNQGYYANPTESCLRSPLIDLTTVPAATLSFAQALDLEAGDTAVVNVLDENDVVIAAAIYTATDSAVSQAGWENVGSIALPVGAPIRIEWCLSGQAASGDYMGWYIDDVQVTTVGSITLKNVSAATETVIPVTDPRVSISGNTLTIGTGTYLETGTHYAVQVSGDAITDLVGNSFAGILDDSTWDFNTATSATGPFPIPLANSGFDADTIPDGTTQASITGWSNTVASGILNPAAGVATPVSGDNVAFTDATSHFVFQGTGHNLIANSRYTVTIHVGRQIGNVPPTWRVQLVTSTDNLVTFTDFAQLMDGGAINTQDAGTVASGSDPGETAQGELYEVTLTWETGESPSGLGDPLFVRFITDYSAVPNRTLWDDASLTVEPLGAGDTFADWIAGFPGVGGQTAVDDDPDLDGNDNGVENYFGTDPGAFSTGLVAVSGSGGTFTFTHPLSETPASDLTATYRWSTDLQTFYDDGDPNGAGTTTVTFSQGAPSGGMVTVTAAITGSIIPDKLFVRVEVAPN